MAYSIEKPTLLDELGSTSTRALTELLQKTAGGPAGYRLRRVLLTNFWLYDYQVFEIPHGRLFLAGDNGSGKSTVLTAAITLALDGDYRPERIDTFGKREKKIDYYILGSNESNTPFIREQRTGYIALEFEWCDMQEPPFAPELRAYWERGEYERARFLTIGLGFHGNRNSVNPITALRFLITDGTRLGDALSTLVHLPGEKARAQDLKSFKKAVSAHGVVCERQPEYAQKVAQYLFHFDKTESLTRLTRQLLYLRQPNLNSVLSLEKVRAYLDESLPELPFDLIQRAAEILEMMQELQDATDKRRASYNAVEKVHRAQQIATMARARLKACEYLHTFAEFEQARKEVERLEKSRKRFERDLARHAERVQGLEQEQNALTGKVDALEQSEDLQLAQRLSQAHEEVRNCEKDLAEREEMLRLAGQRREQAEMEQEEQRQAFVGHQKETMHLLQIMQHRATHEARWQIAAEQLLSTLERVRNLSLESAMLDIPERLSSLLENTVSERLKWLAHLKQLHETLKNISANLQSARLQEQEASDDLDDITRRFEQARSDVCIVQQDLADQFSALLEPTEWSNLVPSSEEAVLIWNGLFAHQEAIQELTRLQETYIRSLKRVDKEIERVLHALQEDLNKARLRQGAKQSEVEHAWKAYEQRQQAPEFAPRRSERRQRARQYLADQHIPALPFYMLVDFTEAVDNQVALAGGIEQMLGDAGLLDALVVLPEYTEAVDALLVQANLGDCRLDIQRLSRDHEQGTAADSFPLVNLLRADPALQDVAGEHYAAWTEVVRVLLEGMQQVLSLRISNDHLEQWSYGVVTGTSGVGMACSIGKATRIRAQQQELERLHEQAESLEQELTAITTEIERIEQRKQEQETLRKSLALLLPESKLEQFLADLRATHERLQGLQERYEQAQKRSRELMQQVNGLRVQLQKEAGETPLFADDAEKVEQAQIVVNSLGSDHRTLMSYLGNTRAAWQRHRRASSQWEQENKSERDASLAVKRAESVISQVRVRLSTLEQMVRGQHDLETLLSQLTQWRTRQQQLPQELQEAHNDRTRAQTNLENNQGEYIKAVDVYDQATKHADTTYDQFCALLVAYPVEMLIDLHAQLADKTRLEITQRVLSDKLEPGEEAYQLLKEKLEERENEARNELSQEFIQVSSLLHAYGPHFDDQGIMRFTHAEEAHAYALLGSLGEEIRRHEQLLEAKERELFENFLLKEMANTVGTRITDAEAWVHSMNGILAQTAFMEEHYRLKWSFRPADPARPGSHLAQYHTVLRRQSETFKQEEIDALVDAFQQEVASVRMSQTSGTATFAEMLTNILDYRRWFQFDIDIIKSDGTVQRLTNKFFKKGSGAEQYIALYIPFFVALSALYESAGRGAPRLIALDEAFDKVSVKNTRNLLNFLAAQNFQWLMTGPHVTGEGTMLPACVRYTMFCRKEDELAVGFPSFWSSDPTITREIQAYEQTT